MLFTENKDNRIVSIPATRMDRNWGWFVYDNYIFVILEEFNLFMDNRRLMSVTMKKKLVVDKIAKGNIFYILKLQEIFFRKRVSSKRVKKNNESDLKIKEYIFTCALLSSKCLYQLEHSREKQFCHSLRENVLIINQNYL